MLQARAVTAVLLHCQQMLCLSCLCSPFLADTIYCCDLSEKKLFASKELWEQDCVHAHIAECWSVCLLLLRAMRAL
jgi:hypothetical protein